MNDGTEEFAGATNPRGLGATTGFVRTGRLNSSGTLQDPIDGNDVADTDATRPMYGLSVVFEVSSSPSTNPNAPAAVSDVAVVPVRRTTDSLTSLLVRSRQHRQARPQRLRRPLRAR